MFTIDQIVSLTQLRNSLYYYGRKLLAEPQALLITRKSGEALVLINGSIFEDLLRFKIENSRSACEFLTGSRP